MGWLDNYNDSKASAPSGFQGDGYSLKVRNYSPAWGGQFKHGGEIMNVASLKDPIAQTGTIIPKTFNTGNPTRDMLLRRQDSMKQVARQPKIYLPPKETIIVPTAEQRAAQQLIKDTNAANLEAQFQLNAEKAGMTREQYSQHLDKIAKMPNIPAVSNLSGLPTDGEGCVGSESGEKKKLKKEAKRENGGWIDKYQTGGIINKRGWELQMKEEENAKKDKAQLQRTGQIPHPRSAAYTKNLVQPEEVRAHVPQSRTSKAKEVVLNPLTAFGYAARGEELPDNFTAGPNNALDIPLSIINPLDDVIAAANATMNVAQGNYGSALVDAAGFIPTIKQTGQVIGKGGDYVADAVNQTYKVNPFIPELKKNFHNIGEDPNWLLGYREKLNPLKMDINSFNSGMQKTSNRINAEFAEYSNKISKETDPVLKGLLAQSKEAFAKGDMNLVNKVDDEINSIIGDRYDRLNNHMDELEVKHYKNTPLGGSLGKGFHGKVYEFAPNNDFAIKIGEIPDFENPEKLVVQSRKFANKGNVAVPLRMQSINNIEYITVMQNLKKRTPNPNATAEDLYKTLEEMREEGIHADYYNPDNITNPDGDFNIFDLNTTPPDTHSFYDGVNYVETPIREIKPLNNRIQGKPQFGSPTMYKSGGIITDPRGQYDHPGKITRIKGGSITMKPDPKTGKHLKEPLLGIANTGQVQMMYPGKDYNFPKADFVTEIPKGKLAKNGKELKKLDQLTNFTNYNTKQPGGWLDNF